MNIRISIVLVVLGVTLSWVASSAKKPTDDTSNPAYASTPVVIAADNSGKPAKPAGFVHPGVLLNRDQLNEIIRRVVSGIEPQKSAFEPFKTSNVGAPGYTPHPPPAV